MLKGSLVTVFSIPFSHSYYGLEHRAFVIAKKLVYLRSGLASDGQETSLIAIILCLLLPKAVVL